MSKYTTELRFICETSAGLVESEGYHSINTILDKCIDKIFDFDFPIFDENYRTVLERKILKHYYTREIATETVGLWKHFLDMRLNEIMPYYNKLYESELLEFNPLYDVDLTKDHTGTGSSDTEHERTDTGTSTNTRTDNLTRTDDYTRTDNLTRTDDYTRTDNLTRTDDHTRTDNLTRQSQDSGTQGESGSDVNKNTRWDIYSDTPQGALTNVENETYLTNARKIIDDGTGSTHNNTTTFGKRVTENDTGTQRTNGSTIDTGTQRNNGTSVDTGTQRNNGTTTNTGTQQDNGSVENSTESTTGIQTTEQYLEHVKGKTPGVSFSKMLAEYRESFLNIDMLIINDLSDLFFNLW